MEWQPIETAPKDGTHIDVWLVEKYYLRPHIGRRIPNVYFNQDREIGKNYSGWVMVETDSCRYLEKEIKGGVNEITHWMPIPEPPSTRELI